MKAVPIPLFNYRKRQCQAILSDPQQLSSCSTNDKVAGPPGKSLVDKQASVGSISRNSDQRNHLPSFPNTANNAQRLAANPIRHGYLEPTNGRLNASTNKSANSSWMQENSGKGGWNTGSSCAESWSSAGWGKNIPSTSQGITTGLTRNNTGQNKAFNNPLSSSTIRNINPRPARNSVSNKIAFNTNYNTSGEMSNAINFMRFGNDKGKLKQPVGRGQGYTMTNNTEACGIPMRARSGQIEQSKSDLWASSSSSGAQWNRVKVSQPQSDSEDGDDRKAADSGPEFTDWTSRGTNQKTRVSQSSKMFQTAGSRETPDLSLRIFTCSIAMIKSWIEQTDYGGLVMFEVYGVVDSAMIRDRTGTGKEFVLRDDTASITCVFYEIDRDIPRLIRGQICRVVGSVSSKLKLLHAVSIRAAQMEERMIFEAAVQLSQEEMASLTIKGNIFKSFKS